MGVSRVQDVVKLITISHGVIRNPNRNNATITKYQALHIDSVTLYPPWGCGVSLNAFAEIIYGMLTSVLLNPTKMRFVPTKNGVTKKDPVTKETCPTKIFKHNIAEPVDVNDIKTFNTIRRDANKDENGQVPNIYLGEVKKQEPLYIKSKEIIGKHMAFFSTFCPKPCESIQ